LNVDVNETGKHIFSVQISEGSRDISGRTNVLIHVAIQEMSLTGLEKITCFWYKSMGIDHLFINILVF